MFGLFLVLFLLNRVEIKFFFAYHFWISSKSFGSRQLLKHLKIITVRFGINTVTIYSSCSLSSLSFVGGVTPHEG